MANENEPNYFQKIDLKRQMAKLQLIMGRPVAAMDEPLTMADVWPIMLALRKELQAIGLLPLLPFVVGCNSGKPLPDGSGLTRRFATAKEAAAYISTLPLYRNGAYYLDAPETACPAVAPQPTATTADVHNVVAAINDKFAADHGGLVLAVDGDGNIATFPFPLWGPEDYPLTQQLVEEKLLKLADAIEQTLSVT